MITDHYTFDTDRIKAYDALNRILEAMEKTFTSDAMYSPHTANIMRVFMLAVSPSYTRNGLASKLIEKSINIAKERNFHSVGSEATSPYSLKAFLNKGFIIHHEVECSTYTDNFIEGSVDGDNKKGLIFQHLFAPMQVADTSRSAIHFVVHNL